MKESLILIANLRVTCTELARHLCLAGINLCLFNDPQLVTQDDCETDFLCAQSDIGNPVSLNQADNQK
jgi:molybdopterin/thiamine biosynthesis adenylyltransferase